MTLERENAAEPATSGEALIPGDRLRTEEGRAEIYFADGTILDIDEFSTIELQGPGLLRLTAGRIILSLPRPLAGTQSADLAAYRVDTPAASATVEAPGEYRIGMLGTSSTPQMEVAVARGRAELATERNSLALNAGERSVAWADGVASYPERFNSARLDAFDQWATAQRDQRTGTRSAQYLPPDLRTYSGAFDQYGAWQQHPSYGPVWYPTVAAGWQPYYYGYWSPLPRFGWTWIGGTIWSWPTHHYGRWGFANSRWFWIPGRRWGPGWVAWGSAPGFVSWTPLGFGNTLALSVGFGRSWGGWIVVPRTRFGLRGGFVHQYALPHSVLVARGPVIRQGVAPPLPAHVVSSARTVVARSRPTFGAARPSIDMTRRTGVVPRNPSASLRGPGVAPRSSNGVMPRYPGAAASRYRGVAPAGSLGPGGSRSPSVVPRSSPGVTRSPSVVPRSSPGIAQSPGAVRRAPFTRTPSPGSALGGAVGNPPGSRVVPRGGGSFSLGPGGVSRAPFDAPRGRADFPGSRGPAGSMVMPRNGPAPRSFDAPRSFNGVPGGGGGVRSRAVPPGGGIGMRPGSPMSAPSVMPRMGGGGWPGGGAMRGGESRSFGPRGGASFGAPGRPPGGRIVCRAARTAVDVAGIRRARRSPLGRGDAGTSSAGSLRWRPQSRLTTSSRIVLSAPRAGSAPEAVH